MIWLLSEYWYDESGAATYVSRAVICDGLSVGKVDDLGAMAAARLAPLNSVRSSSRSSPAIAGEPRTAADSTSVDEKRYREDFG